MHKNFKSPYTCTPGARRLIHIFVDILCWLNKYSVVIHHNRRLQKYFSDFRFGSYFFLEKKTRSYCKYFFFHRQSSFSAAYPEKKVNPFIDSFFPSMIQNNSHKNEIFMYVWYFFFQRKLNEYIHNGYYTMNGTLQPSEKKVNWWCEWFIRHAHVFVGSKRNCL